MNRYGYFPLGLAFVFAASCAHAPKKSASALNSLPELPMLNLCLPRAMHASAIVAPNAAEEELEKIHFTNYFESYLDAMKQREYVACLRRDKSAEGFRKNYAQGKALLTSSEKETNQYQANFPKEKRITDVKETFSDLSEELGQRSVTVTLKDGTQTVVESQFKKSGP